MARRRFKSKVGYGSYKRSTKSNYKRYKGWANRWGVDKKHIKKYKKGYY